MFQKFVFILFSLTGNFSFAQSDFKKLDNFCFNYITGYQSLPKTDDLNAILTSKQFTPVRTPHTVVGLEFAAFSNKDILKAQFRGTGIFYKQNVKPTTIQTTSISLQYGRDLLKHVNYTYLYPFVGFRMFDHTLLGQSTDGKKLEAWKVNFDFLLGVGLKQFLNSELRGIINNLDINLGASLPAINGKWKKGGSEYVENTYKLKPTYFILLTFGRGFRPAPIQR